MGILLGQFKILLNPRTVDRVVITSNHPIPELGLKAGNFRSMRRDELQGDVLNREVLGVDCLNNLIQIELD